MYDHHWCLTQIALYFFYEGYFSWTAELEQILWCKKHHILCASLMFGCLNISYSFKNLDQLSYIHPFFSGNTSKCTCNLSTNEETDFRTGANFLHILSIEYSAKCRMLSSIVFNLFFSHVVVFLFSISEGTKGIKWI